MGYQKDIVQTMKFEYDFAVDGGAVSTIAMRNLNGETPFAGMQITGMRLVAETLLTGTATPTVVIGNTTDADGYFADVFALLTTSAKGSIVQGEVAGALIWDDTNDHSILYAPLVADDFTVNVTIGTQALTAGKFSLYIDFFRE